MVAPSEYEQIFKTISRWPVKDREELIRQLRAELEQRPKSNHGLTMADFLGVARGTGPVPDDEEVKRIVEEARTERYGR
ncbi:MAG TPA: hypothetical protein VN887_09820 [Candidatus Angelobacter sp.]|nr:hypothetical protein [Candidatus Angelobacter sp.]